MKKRALVLEHRITSAVLGHTIRYWIEGDPKHGGLESSEAAVAAARLAETRTERVGMTTVAQFATALLNACPAANSIEVCDPTGQGVAVHRDWP